MNEFMTTRLYLMPEGRDCDAISFKFFTNKLRKIGYQSFRISFFVKKINTGKFHVNIINKKNYFLSKNYFLVIY
jgi:hypothetical protein